MLNSQIVTLAASMFFAATVSLAAESVREQQQDMMSVTETMHKSMMDVKPSGDTDTDFVRMMIPHHVGAVEMAKSYLKVGKDREIRAMAAKVIRDQQKEIAQLNQWLKKKEAKNDTAH